jgi:hypothetical protein
MQVAAIPLKPREAILYNKTSNLKNRYFSRGYSKKLQCFGGP